MPELVALVQSLVDGHTAEGEERELLALLEAASPEELNDALTGGVARPLMTSVDNRVFGPDLRSELIDLLARRRRADLSIEAQAALIHAMQEGHTTAEMERAILDLFLALRGDELTALKNQVNQRTDHHDLEGLVFVDIDDDEVRTRLVEHFQSQAGAATVREAKVLSDIDDTAFSRIHETRYPKGTLIPGVLALYEALDQGPDDAPRSTGDLTFVTARPMDALGLIENHTRDSLRKAGIGTSSVLSGASSACTPRMRWPARSCRTSSTTTRSTRSTTWSSSATPGRVTCSSASGCTRRTGGSSRPSSSTTSSPHLPRSAPGTPRAASTSSTPTWARA
ncbi:hypothetical protein GCM10025862_37360 [Arsenicicoccus piscis]|uniref:DUF222 domain-containing protein n=1 Tax=Arsenicicoccus piscis TaxID=673954 RepID=A0ABQ6HT92_9MICO|nr:hypothetical protein [Arsenicicoccus piscis]GMA18001.1 hypothetical protein GCM10025862_00220 [Arsenicicoccus piscis]GMA21715.1 hypothetical protein GCM10025862_37360 [Arsenicicoccus piscis]